MSGPPVSLGCAVSLSPGVAGPPDTGFISVILQAAVSANGQPFAVSGSLCQMINSVSGAPYVLPIGALGSTSFKINGQSLVRVGDIIKKFQKMLK